MKQFYTLVNVIALERVLASMFGPDAAVGVARGYKALSDIMTEGYAAGEADASTNNAALATYVYSEGHTQGVADQLVRSEAALDEVYDDGYCAGFDDGVESMECNRMVQDELNASAQPYMYHN